jgi:Protein of unknown function (DUF1091)
VPRFNYCDARKGLNLIPLVSDLLKDMMQYGNAIALCPIMPGFYYLRDFPVDRSPFVAFFPSGMYFMHIQIHDESQKRVEVGKFEIKVVKS